MITETCDARKRRIVPDEAWGMLSRGRQVTVAKGRKISAFTPNEEQRETLLKAAMGPSGNLRAPTLRIGDRYLVGYNTEMYNHEFAGANQDSADEVKKAAARAISSPPGRTSNSPGGRTERRREP